MCYFCDERINKKVKEDIENEIKIAGGCNRCDKKEVNFYSLIKYRYYIMSWLTLYTCCIFHSSTKLMYKTALINIHYEKNLFHNSLPDRIVITPLLQLKRCKKKEKLKICTNTLTTIFSSWKIVKYRYERRIFIARDVQPLEAGTVSTK